ncbi:LacI family DNA-binding transcriptional regulator [Leifsonia sp. P73]|uniref:LacI family DNA-binding transcriptional regulator n=1 Tax=Leifsonia sp. P73 TaxID=3423959 RepID=UPI003DA6A985
MPGWQDVQNVGIRDVAKVAGVSVTTVSHALSGRRPVNPETRERVLRASESLGYLPDPHAGGLRASRTWVIGVLGEAVLTTPYAGQLVAGAQEVADEHSYVVIALDSGFSPERETRNIAMLGRRRVDGVVMARMYHQSVDVPAELRGVPLVLANAVTSDPSVSWIAPDERLIATDAVAHLLAHGHRRIGFATTLDDTAAAAGRAEGYRDTLRAAGIEVDESLIVRSPSTAAGGRHSAEALLGRADRPTAVFCFNDEIAMGLYQGAQGRGLRIPEDLSVVGVDDLRLISEALQPGLTTVALPHRELGRWSVAKIFQSLEDPSTPAEQVFVRCALVERGSVAHV